MAKRKLTIDELREVFIYSPETGAFVWGPTKREFYAPCIMGEAAWRRHNRDLVGKPALTSRQVKGYLAGSVCSTDYFAHRVAFAVTYGRWPTAVDHINHDRSDNRLSNLREVTCLLNAQNRRGTGKVFGVNWVQRYKAWQVMIGCKHVGRYKDYGEAVQARRDAEARLGYHENHGAIIDRRA